MGLLYPIGVGFAYNVVRQSRASVEYKQSSHAFLYNNKPSLSGNLRGMKIIMKAFKLSYIITFAFANMLFIGCKTTKSATSDDETPIKVDQCIKLQEDAPERRAWGEGTDYTMTDATAYAQASARTNFAYMLESAVEAGTSRSTQKFTKASSDGENGGLVSDRTGLEKNLYSIVTQQIVKNTTVIKTSPYKQKDGQYHVYVCIEYRGSVGEMAESITSKVNEQLSDEEKLKIQFDYQQYKKEIEEQLKNMKQK